MKLVILAGGKGTRLGLRGIPKPMVDVAGVPLLERHIRLAKSHGIEEVIILSGFLGEVIVEHFGDGSKFGIPIRHVVENAPLGTAGALLQLRNQLDERFMVLYGDILAHLDLDRMIEFDLKEASSGTLLVHPNNHPFDSDLVVMDKANRITEFYTKPHPEGFIYNNLVSAAVYILAPRVFDFIPNGTQSDLCRDVFPKILQNGLSLRAYRTPEYVMDIGTPDRLAKGVHDIDSGKVERLHLSHKQKAIFIDRDGVICRDMRNSASRDNLVILDGVPRAFREINKSEYLAIIITNQPGLAKGFFSEADLDDFHRLLETKLGYEGVYYDDMFYCPHHPDSGYEGEIPELKVECECRKPKPGCLLEAARKYNIDLGASFMVGDRDVDIEAGQNAGTKTILVKFKGSAVGNAEPDATADSLEQAVNKILLGVL